VRTSYVSAYLHKVTIHLIAIEVSIVRVAVRVVHADCLLLHVLVHTRFVRHDTGLVESWLTIYEEDVAIN
jgi:hypothetical protein